MKNIFHVGYPCPVRKQYDPALFQLRDHVAFSDLSLPLMDRGYRYKGPLCLYPFRGEELGDFRRGPEFYEFVQPDDFLLMTTRLPLEDGKSNDKKHIIRSGCHLEKSVFEALRPYFETCSRSTVRLSEQLMKSWAKAKGTRFDSVAAHFNFRQNLDARIAATAKLTDDIPVKDNYPANNYHSIGFFINVPEIPNYGCRCAVSFGMGGDETSVWNRWLSANHPEWFDQPRFIMALMHLDDVPDTPVTLDYAENIKVEVILDYAIPDPKAPAKAKAAK